MTHLIRRLVFVVTLLAFAAASSDIALMQTSLPRTSGITSPETFFGFQMGADKKMARWDKMHLAKHGFGDLEVNMTGGYDSTETPADATRVKVMMATYHQAGIDPLLWPRLAGSWPGVTFSGAPLKLPAGQFGLGHGAGAHTPDEYWLIESANPKVAGLDGAVQSFVDLFYALGASG